VKLDRTEIAVLIVFALVIVTANAWWRVKETGRQAKAIIEAQREAGVLDAGKE
jgi:hypothetical protein